MPKNQKKLTSQEWYDFVSLVAEFTPAIHAGDSTATRRLMEMLQIKAGERVLDVGCGMGGTAGLIAEATGARVTGIDLSPKMIQKARARIEKLGLSDQVDFEPGNVLELHFGAGSFDAVIFESVLTILPGDPSLALAEICRVLKPGGRVGGNEATLDPAGLTALEALLDQHPAIQRVYTAESLQDQFDQAGFVNIILDEMKQSQAPAVDSPEILKGIGCGGLITFFFLTYPRLIWRLITDARIRQAARVDKQVTSISKDYMGYALIAAEKRSEIQSPESGNSSKPEQGW